MLTTLSHDPEVQRAIDEAYREAARADVRAGLPLDTRLVGHDAYTQEYARLPKPTVQELARMKRDMGILGFLRRLFK